MRKTSKPIPNKPEIIEEILKAIDKIESRYKVVIPFNYQILKK
jgi:hypothetical protein